MQEIQLFRGNVIFAAAPAELQVYPRSYIVVKQGLVEGIYEMLPDKYRNCQVTDYGERLIIPGFIDLHVHAPQFYQCGVGLDKELLDWLNEYTFNREQRFADPEYARQAYGMFVDELIRQGTVRAAIFATTHQESTGILFELLQQKGLGAFVGKVNMDRNCPDALRESAGTSVRETEELIIRYGGHLMVKPILTPRFAPTSTENLLREIGRLARKYNLPVQSHIAENRREVEWVRELFPDQPTYAEVYAHFGLFGQTPTLMAHGVYLTNRELQLVRENDVMLVHCPDSNLNIASGIMPVRKLLEQGIRIGLGSDVGGGHTLAMSQAVVKAIQLSKILKVMDPQNRPLTAVEAFYMATKGGGSFFGKVGSLEPGYAFDAIVIEDMPQIAGQLSLPEQLERFIYTGTAANIVARFVAGRKIG